MDDFEKNTSNQDKPYDLRETTYDLDNFQSSYMVTDQSSQSSIFSSQNTISSSQNTASTIEDYNREHYVDLLNNYLNSRKVSAISLPIQRWKDSSKRTKRRYQGLFKECFYTIIDTFFPGEYDDILNNICEDDEHQDEDDNGNSKLITALVESYENSSAWQVRRQVLSVLAIKLSFRQLINYLPGLTEYRYYVAQKHSILYGCAIPPSETCKTRNKMDQEKLSNFLDFITSSHIIKDLPFGERHLKLSSGEVMDAPNIIRCMGPAAIIQQYQAYCEENEIGLLGSSTMFRILSEYSATVRKSLEGLDYFVAEGSRGFQDLQDIVVSEGYPETSNGTELNRLLLEAKRYMKTDYKVHVSEENEVADHCRKFALSSTKEEHFKDKCNHDHNKVCESCEQLKELLHGILKEVEIANFTDQQTKDDIVYRAQQAVESIFLWKSHILRARNQEAAKSFLFNSMKEDEVFVVFDWAMKYLPRKYREDQLDWFGKRGISWHISVCFRRNAEELQSLTFVYIFNSQISQDSKTTSATICDVLNNVLKNNPEVKSVHLWSDNAACYKCADTIININNNQPSKGHIVSYNFCEAQDGKGACDRAAATFKSGIKRYVNQGNDVVNTKQIKTAIERTKKNVKCLIKVVKIQTRDTATKNQASIPGITSYNNFVFENGGLRVWKTYGIGPGLLILWTTKVKTSQYALCPLLIEEESCIEDLLSFGCVKKIKNEENNEESLFTCPTDGCMKSFSRYKDLELHLHVNNCTLVPEKQCRIDLTKTLYVEKLKTSETRPVVKFSDTVQSSGETDLDEGWALRKQRKTTRFNNTQKKFLDEKFKQGTITGNKADPTEVANEMRHKKLSNGDRMFEISEFLSSQQINSYFSRTFRNLKSRSDQDQQAAAQFEQNLTNLNTPVLSKLSATN